MSAPGDCFAACCGELCVVCVASVSNWCFFLPCGSRGDSTSQRGCCNRCSRFDDDAFEREEAKILKESARRKEATQQQDEGTIATQPSPSMEMLQPRKSEDYTRESAGKEAALR